MPSIDDLRLLQAIADVASDAGVATPELADHLGRSGSSPWFGLQSLLKPLEDEGLIEIDPGVALAHRPEDPAPTTEELYVDVTAAGRAVLEPRNS